jgi:hypothetical protein
MRGHSVARGFDFFRSVSDVPQQPHGQQGGVLFLCLAGRRVKEGSSSFLKKEPKNFYESGPSLSGKAAAKHAKVFCFFFSKKKALPFPFRSSPGVAMAPPTVRR